MRLKSFFNFIELHNDISNICKCKIQITVNSRDNANRFLIFKNPRYMYYNLL